MQLDSHRIRHDYLGLTKLSCAQRLFFKLRLQLGFSFFQFLAQIVKCTLFEGDLEDFDFVKEINFLFNDERHLFVEAIPANHTEILQKFNGLFLRDKMFNWTTIPLIC